MAIFKYGTLIFLLLIASTVAAAPTRTSFVGSFGFNWLGQADCKKITIKDLPEHSQCQGQEDSFGLPGPSHICKVSEQIELMVYKTAAQCRAAHEAMQANGP